MNLTEWQKIEELFNAALELPPDSRSAYLSSACQDEKLRSEIESLIDNAEQEDNFLNKPYLSLGLTILSEEKDHLQTGVKIGRYQITRLLGEGGMGEVYLAEDLQLNRQVALKLLPNYLIENDEVVSRFQKEALAASAISHPNIAHIYEAGVDRNRRFIAMEFVEGTTLRELIKQKELHVTVILDILWQTANALAAAHQAGIIHRDIKPENIMIRRDGYVKVLDFGIAKLSEPSASEQKININSDRKNSRLAGQNLQMTVPGLVMGTMSYISPEQLSNKNVDFRTDIWSLGVVLYEILSGNKPFRGKTKEEIREAILHDKPPLFSISNLDDNDEAALQKILTKTLDKKAANRCASMSELSQELKELKQNLEFSQQFSTGEINRTRSLFDSDAIEQTQNSSFITRSKLFWNQQSISRKALWLAACIGIMTFAIGVSFQYLKHFYSNRSPKFQSFSPDSRDKWQISTLFGIRKKLLGLIPNVSLSPDGKAIAFAMTAENTMGIYVKQLNQNEATKIIDGKWIYQTPVWSPDSSQIAFVSNRDNQSAIWTISSDGGTPTLKTSLAIGTPSCELLKWSNDGKRLFFKSSQTLKTIELDSGETKEINLPVANVSGNFSISNDESLIAFMSLDGEKKKLWVYNLKTSALNEIANQVIVNFSPSIFSDNQRLIFSSNQNGNLQLYISDFASGKSEQITFGDSSASSPLISVDDKKIVYVSETNTANIFALNILAKKETRLTEETQMQLLPDLSKDLTKLVFQKNDDTLTFSRSQLKIKNLQTNSEWLLDNQTGFWAKWSPVKDEFAYIRRIGTDYDIWKFDLSSNQLKQITFGGIRVEGQSKAPFNLLNFPFDWSSDGSKITFVSNQLKISNVWMIDSDGINSQKLTNNDNPKLKYESPIWSPDGSKIAFNQKLETEPRKFQNGISLISNNQTKEIFQHNHQIRVLGWEGNEKILASVDNSNEIEIYELSETAKPKLLTSLAKTDLDSLILSPDGKTIAYSARRNGIDNIFSFSVDGTEKQLTDNREDTILFSGISWSPAGDRIFYSKQSGGMQISMISDNSEVSE